MTEQARKVHRRSRKRTVIGFCGRIVPGDVRETGRFELEYGGIMVEVPAANLLRVTPRYQHACMEWYVSIEGQAEILYPVKRNPEEEMDADVEKAIEEECVVVREGSEWLCTTTFFDKLYSKLKEYFGAT